MQKQTISVLVNNHPGVLQRICGLFGRRGYNIESISVGLSEIEQLSRVIIVVQAEKPMLEQINKQLLKLLDVIQVNHLNAHPMLARELMLVKLRADPAVRPEIFGMVETFRCSVVDVGLSSVVIQVVGDAEKNSAFLHLLEPYGILELTRTGETAMNRGDGSGGTS
ncbi:acetolactate synthase small subunit [Paenibacillus sp. NPDC056579]|uniref:acetolactate synthase small subunit n=1 Tax=unclassified Paenibacillus TaxID=185978 RepID=UPI001EF907CB|nr:acetolactate synthase small subunit [Paenibacillus sp. H1-7]ULL13497.1 acetolactate synthase small subunit [Paenibacillus sp. H1-7]